jgi:hypothetical protein
MTRMRRLARLSYLNVVVMLCAHSLGVLIPARAQSRIAFNNRELFLNGCNIAWVNFAADIGPGYTNFSAFGATFDSLHARGGNSMRFWLHTTGQYSPQFNSSGIVDGPGTNTISDLKAILDSAWSHQVGLILSLWSFDMLRISNGSTYTDRAMRMLTDTSALGAYIQNALIPMVAALKGHPGIITWEVFNEAEGMSNEYGWDFNLHVPMANIQRFVNRVAGAIHRTDSTAKVTTGAWAFIAQSDVTPVAKAADRTPTAQSMSEAEKLRIEGAFAARYNAHLSAEQILAPYATQANINYYRDDRLVEAGGDPRGTLDFYTVHYYSWAGTALSPFHHPYAAWSLTKPLVVAEFYLETTFGFQYTELYPILYSTGYAGALTWSWYDNLTQRERTKGAMQDLFFQHPDDIDVNPVTGNIYRFTATPTLIDSGETSTLDWRSVTGSSVTLNGTPVSPNGTLVVMPPDTSRYMLVARGTIVDTVTATVSVYPSGTIIAFDAFPPSIGQGESSRLRWRASNGSQVTLNGAAVSKHDSTVVHPDTTTTYALAASGAMRDTVALKVTVVPADQVNRAFGREVFVSSGADDPLLSDPQHIVDGNFSTQWVSASTNAQWIMIDLGQSYRVKKVAIFWGSNYAKMFRIGISPDNVAWNLVYTNISARGGITTIDSLSTVGRYLKIMLDSRFAQTSGYSVYEAMVYGLPASSAVDNGPFAGTPTSYALFQNYPNPFNPTTTISYALPLRSIVQVEIFDVLGRRVARLVESIEETGYHSVEWNPRVASGLYFCRLIAMSIENSQHHYEGTSKIIVLK